MAQETERYTCDFCGFENDWESDDDVHGSIWGCEKCGKTFCKKCFTDRFGNEEWLNMINNADEVHCPDCWEKYKEEADGK